MAITKSTAYTCSDGKVFNDEYEATTYELQLKQRGESQFTKWIASYSGQRLLKEHSLEAYGTWRIRGEDPNCDFGGAHYQPELGTVQGKLHDVIKYAVMLNGFWTWGSGGDILKVEIKKL